MRQNGEGLQALSTAFGSTMSQREAGTDDGDPMLEAQPVNRPPDRDVDLQAELQFAEDRQLPEGAPTWLPVLCLWPKVTEDSYAAVTECFDIEPTMSWVGFQAWLTEVGLADFLPDTAPPSLEMRADWLPALELSLDNFMDEAGVRAALLRSSDRPPHPVIPAVALWARNSGRWDVLRSIWRGFADDSADIPDTVLGVFADLPADARKAVPSLTWASAVAEADAAHPRSKQTEAFLNRIILDSALLHADWSLREETDTAVLAGVIRMIGERYLPPSGGALEAAWRTKQEIDQFIDERSRKGQPPNRVAHSLFRVISGQLAIFRADLRAAVAEARWGGILAQGPAASDLASAIVALARSLAGEARESDHAAATGRPPESLPFGSVTQMAAVMTTLACGRESLQTLDRAGVERALASITPDLAAIAGVWASCVGLEACHAGVWGDAPNGLIQLFAALADQPMAAREQDEPLGSLLLGRARADLLSRVGAFAAATLCAESIDKRLRTLPLARTLLWAGQLTAAVRTMDLTLSDPDLLHSDRLQLIIIRGAATKLDGSITDDIRRDTLTAFRHLLQDRNYLALALLPRQARDAILELGATLATDPETKERFAELLDRLPESDSAGGGGSAGLVRLTEREAVLLPLLASKDSVPTIAKGLHVSVHTVRKQVATLREKFQASTRAELVRKAGSYGALP